MRKPGFLKAKLDKPTGRASDPARRMARIERRPRRQGYDSILLVPAM